MVSRHQYEQTRYPCSSELLTNILRVISYLLIKAKLTSLGATKSAYFFGTTPASASKAWFPSNRKGLQNVAEWRRVAQSGAEFWFCNTLRRMETAVLKYSDTLRHFAIGVAEIEKFLFLRRFAINGSPYPNILRPIEIAEQKSHLISF